MRRFRIVYVTDGEYPWDVRTEKICLSLSQAGHSVRILARNKNRRPETEQLPEGLVHRIRPWRSVGERVDNVLAFPAFFNPRWYSLIANAVREAGAEIIVVRDLPLCPTAVTVGRRQAVPVVLDMAEHYPAIMQEIFTSGRQRPVDYLVRNPRAVEQVEKYCVSRVDHILTTVEESSARLRAMGVSQAKLTVVGNTPPIARLSSTSSLVTKKPSSGIIDLVYLGIMEVSRGIKELLSACGELRSARSRVRLQLIGGGRDEAMFREYATQLGLTEEEVIFHGFVPYEVAMNQVSHSHVGMLPIHVNEHLNTTVPNKLFDYMSVGLPVITSNSIPSARIVRETNCGEVFREKDVEDLKQAIGRLSDSSVRERKGLAGREAIRTLYHWERDFEALERALLAVVG